MKAFSIVLLCVPLSALAQQPCRTAVAPLVDSAWTQYRAGAIDAAAVLFSTAVRQCPTDIAARTGLGYARLRQNDLGAATTAFRAVLAADSLVVDANMGIGIIAWRRGDIAEARAAFTRVLAIHPAHAEADGYMARMPPALGPPPPRPPLRLPDVLTYPSRVAGERFEVRGPRGWEPFWIRGINLGAALPGKHPSEFPDSTIYASWIRDMMAMGANTVRVYTIHPPAFYQALYDWNTTHPDSLLWLVHGVWTELPPDDDYRDPDWEAEYFAESERVVDLLHGRADIGPRPGHAWGHYTVDVSPWTLAYIIGREWEPHSAVGYAAHRPDDTVYAGRYVAISGGTPLDVWLARALDSLVAYETSRYRTQRPVAYTNWPTLDPLYHPTETTVQEEVALREQAGEQVERVPLEYDNDATGLDARLQRATAAFPAGLFASYHAYPYYPDFMVLEPAYAEARTADGPSHYAGYLRALRQALPDMPIVISEYGVPASLGVAHFQPQGWHHGGHTEAQMAAVDARLTRDLAETGMAGGILFAFMDEWFKKNWIVLEFEIPLERNRLWFNRLDAEQHYGMLAMDAVPPVAGLTLPERVPAWRTREPVARLANGVSVRVAADAAYLWLLVDGVTAADTVRLGFDMVDTAAGMFGWPGGDAPVPGVGLEFALTVAGDTARLMAEAGYNPFRIDAVRGTQPRDALVTMPVAEPALGQFAGRFEQRFNRPYAPGRDSRWTPLRVVTNRPRFGRDGTEFAGVGYDRGLLRPGGPPDGLWERDAVHNVIEVRLPWGLLNVTDPSERRVLHDHPGDRAGEFGTRVVPDIGIALSARGATASGRSAWPTWEEPAWRARRRPVFDVMREVWATLRPTVMERE